MLTIVLNEEEIDALTSIKLNSIKDEDYRRLLYNLMLLLDEKTGEIEISAGTFDEIRKFAIHTEGPDKRPLLIRIFGRSLGENLDLGFFD